MKLTVPFRKSRLSLLLLTLLPTAMPVAFAETETDQENEAVSLPVIGVSGTGALGLTEHTGSYTTGQVNSSTRLGLSIRDTPQTVTVVTRQQIEDFGYQSMDDVLGAVSGVYTYNRGLNGGAYFSRGFSLQTQYDGIQNPWGISESNRNPSPDTAILDHVEVVQGASGLLTGAGDPGGVVNMVRKMPTYEPQASFEISGGSWDYQRAVADFSGPLTESGRVRGRVVGAYQKQNSYVDEEYSNRRVFYGVLEADLTDTTTISANVQIQNNNYNDDFGVIMGPQGQDLGFDQSRFFGADWGDMTKEQRLYTLRLDQQLPNDWYFRAAFNRGETEVDSLDAFPSGTLDLATGSGLSSRSVILQREFNSNAFDAYLTGPVELFDREHELVFGVNTVNQTNRSRGKYAAVPIDNIFTYDPSDRVFPQDSTLGAWPAFDKVSQEGVYTAGRFNLNDSLKLILGSRFSWYEAEDIRETAEWSPYAGIVQDINEWASVYASYSDIFNPQSFKKADGSTLQPVIGSNYEVGLKTEFYDGKLNAGMAIFRLEQTNLGREDRSVPFDPDNLCGGTCYEAADKVVSEGLDLNLAGQLMPNWQMMAGYTYVDSEFASGEEKGRQYNSNMPQHIFRLSTLYDVPASPWSVGGDVQWLGEIFEESADFDGTQGYRTEQGSVALVGLLARYQINEQSNIRLSVRNLFDREYFESVGSTNYFNTYGAPRSAYVTYQLDL